MDLEHGPNPEVQEYGKDVGITLKIMRHGDREGNLLVDLGRERTRKHAKKSGLHGEDFDAVKAIGSPVHPNPDHPQGYGRALETADIYAQEIAGSEKFVTRAREVLSFQNVKSPVPYNHREVYDAALPANFTELSAEEKAKAAQGAQAVVAEHIFDLQTPEARQYKREIAGAFAYLIDHYQKVGKRLHAHSRVLIPAGTHGPMPEFLFLEEALVRKLPNGTETRGFPTGKEFGGGFDPSESMTVSIVTNDSGEEQPIRVAFDNPERPQEEMYLDPAKLEELKNFYLRVQQQDVQENT